MATGEWIQVVGWAGNAAFFGRFLFQWLRSEKAGRSVTPIDFWWLSLFGAACLGIYTLERGEPVLLVGIAVNAAIYARNLWMMLTPGRGLSPVPLAVGVALAMVTLFATGVLKAHSEWSASVGWLVVALVGQGIWSSRFVLQWWQSERTRESHFPLVFWWISLVGNALLLAYTIHLGDAVLIAGYSVGPVVQVRNLMLAYRARRPGLST